MGHLVLLFAATALLSNGCRSANVNRQIKLLEIDNNIGENEPPKRPSNRRFLNITRRPAPYLAYRGNALALTCEALGAPAPNIRWFRNQQPVYEYDMESNEMIDINPSSLARVNSTLLVTRASGVDEYTCVAVAGSNTVQATTVVYSDGSTYLSERTKLFPREPAILVSYKVYVDEIGSTIVLPCRAKGHPKPRVTWTDNKGGVIKRSSRMKVLRSGELVISSLRWSDMGEFACKASNMFGSTEKSTFVYPAKAG